MKTDQYYFSLARDYLVSSNCLKRKYACVIVKDGIVISAGFNASAVGCKSCARLNVEHNSGTYSECPAIHAEQMAMIINKYDRGLRGAKLYLVSSDGQHVTSCPACRNMMNYFGITLMTEQA